VEQLLRELDEVLRKEQVLQNEPMDRHTTFRVGGPAELFLTPETEQLAETLRILHRHQTKVTVIGNGSNLLVSDEGIKGAVIEVGKQSAGILTEGEYVTAQAGALLSKTAAEAYKNGLSGMEFAAGIPGSVGGAMVMNAGAYGGEMKDIVSSVTVLDRDGNRKELTCSQMGFGYSRSCIEENGYLVLAAKFHLKKGDSKQIFLKMEELKAKRIAKQPLEYPSAGSTFRRPEGYFAGKLIMDAGLSGFSIGGARVSEKHCGFVINKGGASAKDILDLIHHIQKTVKEQFDVELEPEVKMIGRF